MEGTAISGCQHDGKYVLYTSQSEVAYYNKKARQLLSKASPLMDIYNTAKKQAFSDYLEKFWQKGSKTVVSNSLPIYTISKDLLESILERNPIPESDRQKICSFRDEYSHIIKNFLKTNKMYLNVPMPDSATFKKNPLHVNVSEIFYDTPIEYTFEEYRRHFEMTKEFADKCSNLRFEFSDTPPFYYITYTIDHDERKVIVSKNKNPDIHFVIHHEKM